MPAGVSNSFTRSKLGLLVVAFVLACGFYARADTLSGRVVDPQQLVVVGAKVSLVCGNHIDTRTTDGGGFFSFTRQAFPESCSIRVVFPSFDAVELPVGQKRALTLQLRLAEQKQTVAVSPDKLSPAPLESVSLSEEQLREISNNSGDLIAYAKQLAGIYSGSDSLYVDGLPADHPPPADRIAAITINADPFSAEYADGGNNHIDITTKQAERTFRVTTLGASLGTKAPDGLNPALSSTSNTANVGLAGPVPYLPIAFTADVHYNDKEGEEPIEAVVPSTPGTLISSVDAASIASTDVSYGLGVDCSRQETLQANASLYVATATHKNMEVGEITLPEAGVNQDSSGREFRTTFTKTGEHFVSHGGISADWFNSDLNANSSGLGVSVLGAFNAGGADVNKESAQWLRWTLKDVFQFNWKNHLWSLGATVTRRADEENIIPDPYGHVYFDNSSDYVLSATTGADVGTGIIMRGQGKVEYTSYASAPFLEAELLRSPRLVVRGGVRADAQTAGGILFSPRLSAVANLHGFVLRTGSGMFVKNWTNDVFLKVMENDGSHLEQYLIMNASLADLEAGTAILQSEVVSKITNLTPTRNWISKISLEHSFKSFLPGVEYTWTDGTHLLGSQRLTSSTGWTDWLESNRTQQKHQIHVRALYKIKRQTFTAHYEWIHSRDDTDGPFSFPAVQDDIRGEWGPSSGIATHNLTFVANSKFGKALSLTLVESWHSPLPLNITSGLDPEENGLYTDRAGLPRNSGHESDYNSMELFLHRRFAVPEFLLGPKLKTYLDFNLQVLNLLGNKDYSSFGSVIGSPLFEQPLAAAPGRSFRFSFGFSH
ncbi:MAG: carboxypeptidase-like regulatory domain-containing protein [Candidatus Sulfotelmatobacter sp.]